ncbi:LysR family transcriptional regulator [Pseudomonas putida]|uniref:LysR substrate-binding domain-containing protein n=1 Tax=Pseudomonas putida TaxID=303 RepID=UPI00125FE0A3|nr:LysR substrate-binding domain-containing protein [Pseudomonas putida]KAB5624526.1 LysR family transcriptional regulator [Pseudomonas putida]
MELRHLRYFVMVAQEKHFTRAAARLNMQQPPLSQQIRALEQELGFDLFIRHAKGVDLTAGGEVFLQEALDILQRVENGAQKAARTAKGIEGNLKVGFTSSAASHPLIPRIIRRYRDLYPDVDIALHEGNARELTDEVSDDSVDIGILRAPVDRPRGIAYHRLLNEELVLTLPVGHPLLDSGAAIALKDLAGEPFILVRRPGAPGMYANLLQACRNAGFEPKVAFEVERMLTNVSLVAAGAGVSVVPTSMRGFHEHSVAYRPIRDARPRLAAPITLLCRQDNPSPQAVNFVALARELGSELRRERREAGGGALASG